MNKKGVTEKSENPCRIFGRFYYVKAYSHLKGITHNNCQKSCRNFQIFLWYCMISTSKLHPFASQKTQQQTIYIYLTSFNIVVKIGIH